MKECGPSNVQVCSNVKMLLLSFSSKMECDFLHGIILKQNKYFLRNHVALIGMDNVRHEYIATYGTYSKVSVNFLSKLKKYFMFLVDMPEVLGENGAVT